VIVGLPPGQGQEPNLPFRRKISKKPPERRGSQVTTSPRNKKHTTPKGKKSWTFPCSKEGAPTTSIKEKSYTCAIGPRSPAPHPQNDETHVLACEKLPRGVVRSARYVTLPGSGKKRSESLKSKPKGKRSVPTAFPLTVTRRDRLHLHHNNNTHPPPTQNRPNTRSVMGREFTVSPCSRRRRRQRKPSVYKEGMRGRSSTTKKVLPLFLPDHAPKEKC